MEPIKGLRGVKTVDLEVRKEKGPIKTFNYKLVEQIQSTAKIVQYAIESTSQESLAQV